ncbi:MAG: SRPBCC family protein [Anaerolineae bacterium]|nr:SRPBCC family protein [Anaerolineae bacterium]
MALIDQRILIDAPIEVVWDHLTDPDKIARWHVGYTSISILTTHRMGSGVRRRCMLAGGGKDIIEEITTWVDHIGYEYTLTEGGAYRSFQARLRLQTVPDGILVQWTITYHPKGFFGAIMDRLTGRRQLAALVADSLRQLKRNIDQLGVRLDDTYRERVGMQGRLNVDERAEYQRRYAPPPGIDPIGTPPEPIPAVNAAPSFVAELIQAEGPAEYSHAADTQPRKPEGLEEAISAQQADQAATNQQAEKSTTPTPSTPVEAVPVVDVQPDAPTDADQTVDPGDQAADLEQATAPTQPTPPTPIPPVPSPPEHIAPPRPAMPLTPAAPHASQTQPESAQAAPSRDKPSVQPIFERPQSAEHHVSPPTPVHAMPPVTANTDEIPTDEKVDTQTGLERFQRPAETPLAPTDTRPREIAHSLSYETPLDHPTSESNQAEPPRSREGLPPQTPVTDTGEISIWEVFGMPRPSDQDTQTLEELVQTVRAREEAEKRRKRGSGKPRRIRVRVRCYMTVEGLRRRLRWRVIRVRRRRHGT